MVDTLEVGGFQLTPIEYKAKQGRQATPSPFLPVVKASVENGYAGYSFDFQLNGKTADEHKADLEKVIRQLRRAGAQLDTPVTVMAQAESDISKSGSVTIGFKTREKITKAKAENAA